MSYPGSGVVVSVLILWGYAELHMLRNLFPHWKLSSVVVDSFTVLLDIGGLDEGADEGSIEGEFLGI